MLKMLIRMDNDKINIEKKYKLEGIYTTIDNAFLKMGLPRIADTSGALVYCDNGNAKDYGRFGKIVNTLKKQSWFMDNVVAWRMYDSDNSDTPDDFNEEDLLVHYKKQTMEGQRLERKYYKALNFDLSTHQLNDLYPGTNYRKAYEDLRRLFMSHNFFHRQGSGYISGEKLSTADIFDLMDDLSQECPWIGDCVNKIDITNVGRQYDLTDLLKPTELSLNEDIILNNDQYH